VIQPVLPLDECLSESVDDPAAAEFAAEPLHSVADPAATGAAVTETSCLCVQV
jgi:hypothetical protein